MPSNQSIEAVYGPQVPGEPAFRRRCRLLQSWHRVNVLHESRCGPYCPNGRVVGSSLANGEASGANFLTPTAFAYAQEKVAQKLANPDLTIDEYRLWNNMLSSMPMCFNLFSDLRSAAQGDAHALTVLAAMFTDAQIAKVSAVEVEMLPTPISRYTADKTALDAAILFEDRAEASGLVAIETKYTDPLGTNRAADEQLKLNVAKRLGLFTPAGLEHYASRGFDQLARNVLLAHAYAAQHSVARVLNYVLSPKEDREAPAKVAEIRARLAEPLRPCVIWLPLETLIEQALHVACPPLSEYLIAFHRRYLDFSQVRHLL